MKAILTTCICSLILTISLTSCFSLSTTRTTNPTPYTTTTVSQQNRGVFQKPSPIERITRSHPILKPPTSRTMLYTIALVFIILWLLGLVSSYTMGGFIHILLVVALVVLLVRIIQGNRIP